MHVLDAMQLPQNARAAELYAQLCMLDMQMIIRNVDEVVLGYTDVDTSYRVFFTLTPTGVEVTGNTRLGNFARLNGYIPESEVIGNEWWAAGGICCQSSWMLSAGSEYCRALSTFYRVYLAHDNVH